MDDAHIHELLLPGVRMKLVSVSLITAVLLGLLVFACSPGNDRKTLENSTPEEITLEVNLGGSSRAERFLGTFDEIDKLTLDIQRNFDNREVVTGFQLTRDNTSRWSGTINNLIVSFDYTVTGHAFKTDNASGITMEIFRGETQHTVTSGTNSLSLRLTPLLDERELSVPRITRINRPFQMVKGDNASIGVSVTNTDLQPLVFRFRSVDNNSLPLDVSMGGSFTPASGSHQADNSSYPDIETTYNAPDLVSMQNLQVRVSNDLEIGVTASFKSYVTGPIDSETTVNTNPVIESISGERVGDDQLKWTVLVSDDDPFDSLVAAWTYFDPDTGAIRTFDNSTYTDLNDGMRPDVGIGSIATTMQGYQDTDSGMLRLTICESNFTNHTGTCVHGQEGSTSVDLELVAGAYQQPIVCEGVGCNQIYDGTYIIKTWSLEETINGVTSNISYNLTTDSDNNSNFFGKTFTKNDNGTYSSITYGALSASAQNRPTIFLNCNDHRHEYQDLGNRLGNRITTYNDCSSENYNLDNTTRYEDEISLDQNGNILQTINQDNASVSRFHTILFERTDLVRMPDNGSSSDNSSQPGITVNVISDNTTEAGGTASFTVVLDSQPFADVTIPISSDNISEGTVNFASLTFTASNWNDEQTITVTGVDDTVFDGDQSLTIVMGTVSSSDINYNGMNPDDVSINNIDNDILISIINQTNANGRIGGISLSPDNSKLYAAFWEDGMEWILEYSLPSLSLLQTIQYGSNHGDVVVSNDGNRIFVSNYYSSTVSQIKLDQGNAITDLSTMDSWPGLVSITPDRSKVLVSVGKDGRSYDMNNDSIAVYNIDNDNFSLLASVGLSDEPQYQLGVSEDSGFVYVPTRMRNSNFPKLYEISLSSYQVTQTMEFTNAYLYLQAATSVGDVVYVADDSNSIWAVNRTLWTKSFSYQFDEPIHSFGGHPGNKYLFVRLDTSVVILEIDSMTVVGKYEGISSYGMDIEFNSDGTRMYTSTSSADGEIYVFQIDF